MHHLRLYTSLRIDEYLQLAETLEDFGSFHFQVTRRDGLPCRLSVNIDGVTLSFGNEKSSIPFSDISKVTYNTKAVKIRFTQTGQQPLVFYTPNSKCSDEILKVIMNNYAASVLSNR
ncbi:hypothetical protein SK128_015566 [Halocaridina rubra]|uniref:FERM domain-containing protein n=1 Tax=Halocaridina rubra TaxID=373956 RepID=A0AAN9AES1_HALRR